MNKLMITAAAAALMLPLSAGAVGNPNAEKMDTEYSKADKKHSDMKMKAQTEAKTPAINASTTASLAARSMSVKELLGEGIRGVNGDRIARVDDIVIDANGKADSVVFLSGGVFGLGGTRGALDFNAVDFTMEDDYEPVVHVSLSEEGVKSAVEYETTQMNDYSLASELIGTKVDLVDGADEDDDAVINDIIIASDGTVENLIIQESVIGSIGAGEKYAVAYSSLTVEQGDGGLMLNLTEEQLKSSPRFTSIRENIGAAAERTWENTEDKVEDAADDMEDEID